MRTGTIARAVAGLNVFQIVFLSAGLLLLLGYATGFVTYYSMERFAWFKPFMYLGALGGILSVNFLMKKPVISVSMWLYFGLLLVRFLEVLLVGAYNPHEDAAIKSLYITSIVYFLAMAALAADGRILRITALFGSAAVVVICTLLNLWEWNSPGYFSSVEGRSAGWLVNANGSATAICICVAVFMVTSTSQFFSIGVAAVAGFGVYFTLSRGGMVAWLLVITAYFLLVAKSRFSRFLVGMVYLAAFGYGIISSFDLSRDNLGEDIGRRQSFLVGGSSIQVRDEARYHLALENLAAVWRRPLVGYGAGASMAEFQPHNQIIGIWMDSGLFGLLCFLAAFVFLILECWRSNRVLLVAVIPIFVECFFSHNLLDDRSLLFAWVALCGLAATGRGKGKRERRHVPAAGASSDERQVGDPRQSVPTL
jgi:O-antigen ligase